MISVSNLAMQFGDRLLFQDASFQLNAGDRYGLVGANGPGKTTLLNILAGDLEPTAGSVALPKSLRLGVLRQDQFLYEDDEIVAVALMGHPSCGACTWRRRALLANAHESFDADHVSEQEDAFQRMDGYTAETRRPPSSRDSGFPRNDTGSRCPRSPAASACACCSR